MTISRDERRALDALEVRLETLLPEQYRDSYEDLEPVSMGSAALKYGADGKVAWDEIWGSFCHLAMAGGPPHKGTLLEPASRAEVEAEPDRHMQVVDELSRGIMMAADLAALPSPVPGWIRVDCFSQAMAGWLARAIVMENVAAHADGMALHLPAAPHFRLEKEIKNVVTAIAKTYHYWTGHMSRAQRLSIGSLFAHMARESPLVEPARADDGIDARPSTAATMVDRIHQATGLRASRHQYVGWLGLECASVGAAVWMMRALVASNVSSRREGTVLFVPINPVSDPDGERVARALSRIHRLASAKSVL